MNAGSLIIWLCNRYDLLEEELRWLELRGH